MDSRPHRAVGIREVFGDCGNSAELLIKHKGAALLKRELQTDTDWIKFTQSAAKAARKIQQTMWMPLAPPNQSYRHCSVDMANAVEECANDERANRVREEWISFVERQSLNAGAEEVLLGGSEVPESAIGKFKSLEHDQVKSGFTSMLLSFAAFLSKTTQEVVQTALQVVPTNGIREWFNENIGQSVQSQRKTFLKLARAAE